MRAFTLLIIILLSFNAHAQRKGLVSSDKLLQLALQETNEHRNYNKAIALCKKGLAQSPGYTDIRLLLGKLYMLTGRPAAARSEWQGVLKKEPANIDALHYLVNLEYSQHHIKETMDHINTALRISPEDKVLLLKKYGILQESKQREEQAKLLALMHFYFPDDKKIERLREEYRQETIGRQRPAPAQAAHKPKRRPVSRKDVPPPAKMTAQQPLRMDLEEEWKKIHACLNAGNTDSALAVTERALLQFPNDTLLLFKRSGLLESQQRYTAAAAVSRQLMQLSPNNKKYRQAYVDQQMEAARLLLKSGQPQLALPLLQEIVQLAPQQHDAWLYLINLEAGKGNYQQSIAYCDSALAQLGNDSLIVQKRNALWQEVNEKAIAQTPADTPATEKKYHNQAGVIHLQSIYGNGNRPASITSLQYLRYHNRGSVTGRVNYADRASGNGLQLEAETYYNHNPQYYSYGLLGWSDAAVFPKFRAGYSLFRNFKKGWEGELGARYLRADSVNTWSAVWSAGKYWGNNWTNLRGYVITEQNKWYQAYTLTHRMYLHDDKEFIAFLLSLGTTPDDRSRNFQFNRFVSFISKSAGIGYQKTFGSRTTASIYGNWINQRTGNKQYYNQYDIYLTLLYKF